ncbi:MAG: ROK family protein [Elusimicrobiales bacterium]
MLVETGGAFEAYCSARRVCDMALRIKGIDRQKITPRAVYMLAKNGDSIAKKIWFEYGRHLGYGIGNVAVSFNPEVVVITGGLSRAYEFFKDGIMKTLKAYKMRKPIESIKIHITSTKAVGVLGCADIAMQEL